MAREVCIICERMKKYPSQGRFIDGTHGSDVKAKKAYHWHWVCSDTCYSKTLEEKP